MDVERSVSRMFRDYPMQPSLKRLGKIFAIGMIVLAVPAVILLDPTMWLLWGVALIVLFAAASFGVRRARHRIGTWYSRRPLLIRGAIAGCIVWACCTIWWYAIDSGSISLPSMIEFPFAYVTSLCAILSWPVAVGGWIFLWGDNGAPDPMLNGAALNLLCGLVLNAGMGAIGIKIAQYFPPLRELRVRLSLRSLMCFFVLLSAFFAVLVAYCDDVDLKGNILLMACACGHKRASIVDGKLILAEPNHETPAGSVVGTIRSERGLCIVTLVDKDGVPKITYELVTDHLGAKCYEHYDPRPTIPIYIVMADTWKVSARDSYYRVKWLSGHRFQDCYH